MALYRINRRNTLFEGIPGDFVRAEPDPMMDAAVKSGIVTRVDVEEPPKKSRKRRDKQEKPGDSDGGEGQASGDQVDT
jgi:hypothetical protein